MASTSESINNRLYTFTTGDTTVYSLPSYSSVTALTSFITTESLPVQSYFDSNNYKIFVGDSDSGTIKVIDVTGLTNTTISITGETFGMSLDSSNSLLAVSNLGGGTDEVTIIDTVTNSVNYVVEVSNCFKGGVATDQNGNCYVVGYSDIMTKVDMINGVTASTLNIGDNGQYHEVIYNTTNGYIYTLSINNRLKVYDSNDDSLQANLNLTSYSGNATAQSTNMVYNPDKDYIYILNQQIDGSIGIITVRCDNNTILSFTNNILNTGNDIYMYYDTIGQRLYLSYGNVNTLVLST